MRLPRRRALHKYHLRQEVSDLHKDIETSVKLWLRCSETSLSNLQSLKSFTAQAQLSHSSRPHRDTKWSPTELRLCCIRTVYKPSCKQLRWSSIAVALQRCSVISSTFRNHSQVSVQQRYSFWSMSPQKLDFIVQQTEDLQPANTGLKAGAALILSRTESNELVQVIHDGAVLGSVPNEQNHLLPVNLPSCTVRSVRKQDGKVTQIVVRAVLLPTSADTCQYPGIENFCLTWL